MTSLDVRLLPIAIALWAGSAIGLHTAFRVTFFIALALLIGPLLLALVRRHVVSIWIAASVLGVVVAAFRVDAAAPIAVTTAIANSGVVTFKAVLESDPQAVERNGFGGVTVEPMLIAKATLVDVIAGKVHWHTALPVTLQWSPDGLRHAVGEHVGGAAVPRPADAATRSAYWIRVQGRLEILSAESRGAWLASRVRDGLARATDAEQGSDGATLLPGLVLGDTRAQSTALVDDLRVSGLSHLTAVSGANLAIVLGAVLWALRRTRIRSQYRHGLLLGTIASFVVVVQPQPSVVRAAMMGGISVFALASGARRASASTLWLSVVLLLVIDPFLAWQWGFALSVAATGGLVLIGPHLVELLAGRRFGAALAVTLSAQLATFPVLLAMGRPPTWLSVPANLLCEPLVAPATVSGFLASLIAAFSIVPVPAISDAALSLAAIIAWPGVRLADLISWIAHVGVGTPLAVAPITSMSSLMMVVSVFLLLYRIGVGRHALLLVAALGVTLTSCLPNGLQRWPQADWWYAMCDVGQGDSSVINLGAGQGLLIDAGPDPALERMCLRRLGVSKLTAVFITHFHADHVEGLVGAIRQADIGEVFATSVREPAIEWQRVRDQLEKEPVTLQRGDVLQFGPTTVQVLWPDESATTGDPNNGSLVLDISRDGVHVLVTGDADAAAQTALALPMTAYALIKVPHHGSRFQDPAFVRRVRPALALVSVGAGNDYGHPAASTLDAYRAAGVRVLRTDLSGSIAVSVHRGRLSFAVLS
jgi:competence protein ComEC